MSKNNTQKIKNKEDIWVIVMFLTPIVFLLYYFVLAPILSDNSGFNKELIISLSIVQGVAGSALTLVSLKMLNGIKKALTLLGLLGSAAFFFYAYFLATFSITF